MRLDRVNEELLQALEHERACVEVYDTALQCAATDALRQEWERNRAESCGYERLLREVCDVMNVDPDQDTPARTIVRQVATLLVDAMQDALQKGNCDVSERVACKCVLLAESKDYLNWGLLQAPPPRRLRGPARRRTIMCPTTRVQRRA